MAELRFRWARLLLITLSWAWLGLLSCWGLLRVVFAERLWWMHPTLYLPVLVWFLPGLLLLPFHFWLRSRHVAAPLLALLVAVLLHPPRFGSSVPAVPGVPFLSVVTLNGGKREDLPPRSFVASHSPDFILLQDARDHYLWDSRFPGYQMTGLDEFVLLSRWPVVGRKLYELDSIFPNTIAARFVVRWQGREIALYAVHFPSPRQLFRSALGWVPGKSPWGLLSADTRRDYENRLDVILAAHAYVRLLLASEKLPAIVAGDFNLPPSSLLIRKLGDEGWTDCFAERGGGGGYSFPGDYPFWAAFHKPWLRLDYVFHSPSWRALSCGVEDAGPGQHSAVGARLQLKQP